MTPQPITGLVAAPFTPFQSDGNLAFDTIPRLAGCLAKNRVSAAFVCGTTGEGVSLTLGERRKVAGAWRDTLPDGMKLIVHVGGFNIGESQELARHAQAIGADAIASIAPSFFKPAGPEALVAWCAKVASAAPELPFYYYHMPAMTGVRIPAAEFLAQVNDQIPNLAGIKFTDENLVDFERARAWGKNRYTILFGRDEMLLSGLERGAPGAVGSTYNYAAPLFHRIIEAQASGNVDEARKHQQQACQFIDILNEFGGLPAGKAIMKLIGVDCGPVRLPLTSLDPAKENELRQRLQAIGFFEYASQL
jgi:N-acetylneuraminate lyase